jgi:hypothetical protein
MMSASVMTVKGTSVSSTRQLTVGWTNDAARCGTPVKPSSRNGTSNSSSMSPNSADPHTSVCTRLTKLW